MGTPSNIKIWCRSFIGFIDAPQLICLVPQLIWMVPQVTMMVFVARADIKINKLKKEQEELLEEWGEAVASTKSGGSQKRKSALFR